MIANKFLLMHQPKCQNNHLKSFKNVHQGQFENILVSYLIDFKWKGRSMLLLYLVSNKISLIEPNLK